MSPEPKANSTLPDDDALKAFAAGAFGPRRAKKASSPKNSAKDEKPAEQPAPKATPIADQPPQETPPEPPSPASTPPEPAADDKPPVSAAPAPEAPPAPAPVVPQPAASAEDTPAPAPRPAAELVLQPEPVQTPRSREVATVQIRNLGEAGQRATQCTIMVSGSVRERFAHYQLTKKMQTGKEPTNAVVVRRAVLNARKNDLFAQLLEQVRHRQQPVEEEDHDPDGLFGEVPGRRAERGRMKDSVQQSFRPSYQELEVIDAMTTAYGFPSRSDFLDAALDAFLPPLPAGKNRAR